MRTSMPIPKLILFIFLSCCSFSPFCQEAPSDPIHFFLNQPEHHKTSWTITGILYNEQNEPYGFNFSLYRQATTFQVVASIIDLNQQKLLWQQSDTLFITEAKQDIEKIGAFFWHFSPINSSLIIGYEDHKQQIFNLKFDLLEPATITPTSSLTKDLKLKQYFSGHLNGHIYIGAQEQFVTSQSVWLQEIWQDELSVEQHPFQEILCKFHDGSSLFAIQVHEKTAIRAAYAGRFDADGHKQTISQFLNLELPKLDTFNISLEKNKHDLELHHLSTHDHQKIFASNLPENKAYGICLYQSNPWSKINEIKPVVSSKPSFLEKTLALTKKPFKIPFKLKNKFTS